MTILEHLADYTLSMTEKTVPQETQVIAKGFFVDALSCMFLGAECAAVKKMLPYVQRSGGRGPCIFPGREPVSTDAAYCAMLCAMAAHSGDFDDMSISMNGHPSALLIPVVFSAGQEHGASGKDMLLAYMAGVETDAILGRILQMLGCRKGVNPTTLIGCFGGAVAAGKLAGLTRKQMVHALNIVANDAGGLKANFGTTAKDISIGLAAWKSVFSVACAQAGIDASTDALDGPFGLLESLCGGTVDQSLVHRMIREHVSDFQAPGLVMKPYPTCRGNHSGIDCITKIMTAHSLTAEQIERVICRVDQAAYDTDRYLYPKTPSEAKFSLPYCIAKVICNGEVNIEDFVGETLRDTRPLSILDRIEVLCVPEIFPDSRFGAEIEVHLTSGEIYREKELYAKGDPMLPMTEQEIQHKLVACLTQALGSERSRDAAELLCRFDTVDTASDILKFLYPEERLSS